MKIKELEATANVVWSPQSYYPVTLAAGSAAQQVDASFSSNLSLNLYTLNLGDPGFDLEQKVSIPVENKYSAFRNLFNRENEYIFYCIFIALL